MLGEPKVADGNRIWITEEGEKDQNSADYDEALAATGYGLSNVLILLGALPVGWTCVFDTTSTAFILQATECDFELTWLRRSVAVGIVYIGTTVSGPLWDSMLRDRAVAALGRRDVLLAGLVLDSACNVASAHATSFPAFVLCKFVSGLLIAGPLSVVMPYLADFHSAEYRSTLSRWANLLIAASNIFPPALACTLVLYTSWFNFTIFHWFYETWRVYLLICAISPLLGVVTISLMPKSPKFLLTKGDSKEALRILKIMYAMNKFESSTKFKIKKLLSQGNANGGAQRICKDGIQDNVAQIKSLLSKPHLRMFLITLILHFTSMLGFNTMRLWVPQLFVALNNFRVLVQPFYPRGEVITMCEMLFPRIQKINCASCNYTLPDVESAVYVNSTIIASSAVTFGFFFILTTDTAIRKIIVMAFSFMISAIASFGMNWSVEIPYMLVLCSFIIVTSRISGNSITTFGQDITPTSLRTTATRCMNFVGNVGAAVGSIAFPVFLELNCLFALMGIGFLMLVSLVLSFFLIQRLDQSSESNPER